MYTLIKNVTLLTPFRKIESGEVLIRGKKILKTGKALDIRGIEIQQEIDGKGLYASPGFIDLHVHGGGGYDTTEGDPDGIVKMCEAHCMQGTTSILPTTLAAPFDVLCKAIEGVKEARQREKKGNILGIHLEGPYFSQNQRGAQSSEWVRNPAPEEYMKLLDLWEGIRMMGAAPELPGAMELGQELRRRGITASIAHTDADFDTVAKAIENGYTDITHIYSGCSSVVRKNAYRIAGVVEAGLFFDELTVQVIADGKHLPASLLKLIYKCKGGDRISLISDGLSFSASELVEGKEYRQKNGVQVVLEDGVMKLLDRQSFAGSVATSRRLVKNMVELAGVSLQEAVKMASWIPSKVLRMEKEKGALAPGYDADLLLFDKNIEMKWIMAQGKVVLNKLTK